MGDTQPLCRRTLTGHPVDVASGVVFTAWEDFSVPGPVPLVWRRFYNTSYLQDGPFGKGWVTPYSVRLRYVDGRLLFLNEDAVEIPLAVPEDGQRINHDAIQYESVRERNQYIVWHWSPNHHHRFVFDIIKEKSEFRLSRVEDLARQGVELLYTGSRWTGLKDSGGRTYRLQHDNRGLVQSVTLDPDEPGSQPIILVRYEYDRLGRLTAVYNRLNNPLKYSYDDRHRLIRETGRMGTSFRFEYDANGRCVENGSDDGALTRFLTYDPENRITSVADSLRRQTVYQFNELGLVTQITTPSGAAVKRVYDMAGRLTMEFDPLGNLTVFAYDHRGNRVSVTDPLGNETRSEFDDNHDCVMRMDPAGNQWTWEYDEFGQLLKETGPLGQQSEYRYDKRGNLVAVEDAKGSQLRMEWNRCGQLVQLQDWEGGASRFAYDRMGNEISESDADGSTTRHEYDMIGRLVRTVYPDRCEEKYAYDADNNLVRYDGPNGNQTRWDYGPMHKVRRRIDPAGNVLEYRYDSEGQLTEFINENRELVRFTYDSAGRLTEQVGFDGRKERFEYDAANRVIKYEDHEGKVTTSSYDAIGNLVLQVLPAGETVTFAYDCERNLVEAVNSACRVAFERDELGRVVREIQGDGVVESEFDVLGNRILRRTSGGQALRFEYDRNSLLSAIAFEDGTKGVFRRDTLGRIVERGLPQGAVTAYGYDVRGRMNSQTLRADRGVLFERSYTYDGEGNLCAVVDSRSGREEFAYDACQRLIRHEPSDTPAERFGYDAAGNVAEAGIHGGVQAGAGNRVLECDGVRLSYDGNGSVTGRAHGDVEETLSYDSAGRLARVTRNGSHTEFAYDALGRRVKKATTDGEVLFHWDGQFLAAEETPLRRTEYLFEPEDFIPICMIQEGKPCFFETDRIGTPVAAVSGAGELLWTTRYFGFGETRGSDSGSIKNPLRFQGQYFDEETGLHYNRHRYYDPCLGRFVTQDPIGIGGGHNLYGYGLNPYSWIDPLGLSCHGGTAAETLPPLKGKSVPHVERTLAKSGFRRTNPTNARNQRWVHPDGSQVQIHAYGDIATGDHRSGNNAHVHKDIGRHRSPGTVALDDHGHASADKGATHIGISNPPDFPAQSGRPHGTGVIP